MTKHSPIQTYWQQIAPAGSSLYYSLLFVEPSLKADYLSLYALYDTLQTIPLRISDPGIARTKLFWWQDEFDKMIQQHAVHPLTQQLQAYVKTHALTLTDFLPLISHPLNVLDQTHITSTDELLHTCKLSRGSLHRLLLPNCQAEDLLDLSAIILGLCHYVFLLRDYINHSSYTIPNDALPSLFTLAHTHYATWQHKLKQCQKPQRQAFSHLHCLLNLAYKRLQFIQQDKIDCVKQTIHLTPIRKLLLAIKLHWFY